MRLCADAGMRPPTLRHKGDDRTYSDALLRRTLCAIHARAPKLPSHAASFDVASSLEETHARALAAHFKTHSAPGNVLCYGVRRKRAPSARDPPPPDRGTPGGANITGRPDLEVSVASAATTSLLGVKHWRTFHERVGDALMTHVLVHGSVFVPSALMRSNSDPGRHGSHLQLCGAPVSAVGASRAAAMARHKRAAQAARADRTTTPTQRRRKKTEKRKRREATNAAEADEVGKNKHKRAKKTFNPRRPGWTPQSAGSKLWRLYTGHAVAGEPAGTGGWIRGTRGRNGAHGNGVTFDDVTGGGDASSSGRVRRGRGTHREPVHVTRAEDGAESHFEGRGRAEAYETETAEEAKEGGQHTRGPDEDADGFEDWTRMWWRSPTRVSPHVRTNPRTLWETRDDRINRPG